MRKLMWFTLGVLAGIGAGFWVLTGNWLWVAAAVCLLAGLVLSFLPLPGKYFRIIGCVMLGCTAGLIWMFLAVKFRSEPAMALDERLEYMQITVSDYGTVGTHGSSAEGTFHIDGKKYKTIFHISNYEELAPGDTVTGWFILDYVGYDGIDSTTYHQSKGIMLVAYSQGDAVVNKAEVSLSLFSAVGLRHGIKAMITQLFPEDTRGFAVALLLGDSSGLSPEADNALQNSGIRHIIAVSGLHVSMVFGMVHFVSGKRKWYSLMVGVPILFAFAAVAGFTPSVLRACLMQTVLLVSYVSMREYDSLSALSAAVLILLGIDPFTFTSISFQLSALCVLGITLFGDKIYQYLLNLPLIRDVKPKSIMTRICKTILMSVSISVSAMILTLPVSSYYFGVISTVSVLTNLLTLWAVTYIFCGLLIACLLGALYAPLGMILAQILSVLVRYVLWVARMLSQLPYSSLGIQNTYIVIWLVFAYVLLLAHVLLKRKRFLLTGGCLIASLCVALLLNLVENKMCSFQATVLDVGQGQCIIFQSDDQCYVVDCGGDSASAAADLAAHQLKNQGVTHIDGIILTHFDYDHGGGIHDLMAQIPTDHLYLPDADHDTTLHRKLVQSFDSKIIWVRDRQYISFGEAMLTLYPAEFGKIGNESSMCILFQSGNYDILITGDKDREEELQLLQEVVLPQIEVLIAGHHGSADSTSVELLRATRPKLVVVSADGNHQYGHPASGTLTRLEIFGCRVLRTDLHGTIIFRG